MQVPEIITNVLTEGYAVCPVPYVLSSRWRWPLKSLQRDRQKHHQNYYRQAHPEWATRLTRTGAVRAFLTLR
jgi:hypothetical protein